MNNLILRFKIWKDQRGQDLIEYALMAGFVAVAAGAVMPGDQSEPDLFEGWPRCRLTRADHNWTMGDASTFLPQPASL
jgi:hypothetical protein